MPGGNKKQFIRRNAMPTVAAIDDFEDRFARQVESRRHYPMDIPIDLIDPSPFQIRQRFDNIEELATAMRLHGFTSRLWVREHPTAPGRYQLVFGERRLRAAREADLQILPCEVTQFHDRELLEIGLTENLQRQDLDPLEEAQGLQRFMQEFNYSFRELAERIGKDKGYVENRLRLLRMPDDIQQMVVQRPETMSAAREVARLPTAEARAPLIEELVKEHLSLTVTRTIIDEALAEPEQAAEVIATRVNERRSSAKAAGDSPTQSERVNRALEQDWPRMVRTVRRWRAHMPMLHPEQRTRLQARINDLLVELEGLAQELR